MDFKMPTLTEDMIESVREEAMAYEQQELERDAHAHVSNFDILDSIHRLVNFMRDTRPRPSESECRKIVPDLSIKYPSLFLMVQKTPGNFTAGQPGLRDIKMMLNVRDSMDSGAITPEAADKVISETFFADKCADTIRALQQQGPPKK